MVITREMIHRGFTKGGAFNLPTGEVRVALDGERDKIEAFHKDVEDNIIEWLKKSAGDEEKLLKKIGNPGINVKPVIYDEDILVLDIGLYSHSLSFDQIYKGIDTYGELNQTIKIWAESTQKLNSAVDGLNTTIKSIQK